LLSYTVIRRQFSDPGPALKIGEKINITTAELAYDLGRALNLEKATFLLTGAFQLKIHLSTF
jgi:hypothetical protein